MAPCNNNMALPAIMTPFTISGVGQKHIVLLRAAALWVSNTIYLSGDKVLDESVCNSKHHQTAGQRQRKWTKDCKILAPIKELFGLEPGLGQHSQTLHKDFKTSIAFPIRSLWFKMKIFRIFFKVFIRNKYIYLHRKLYTLSYVNLKSCWDILYWDGFTRIPCANDTLKITQVSV